MEKNKEMFFVLTVKLAQSCVCVNICALCALCVFLGGSVAFAGPGSLMAQDSFKKNHVGDLYKNEFQLSHKLEVKL